jgi:hypothetical protein
MSGQPEGGADPRAADAVGYATHDERVGDDGADTGWRDEGAGEDVDAMQDERLADDGADTSWRDEDVAAHHDEQVDAELDRLDDGGGLVGPAPGNGPARSEALPFVLTAREHFASAGDVEITGDARVDAATARLEEIPDLPTSDHVAVYDDVHRRLQDALADADVR